MNTLTKTQSKGLNKQYKVAINTVALPENPQARIQLVVGQIKPVINQIVTDAMTVAIGTWPTPEKPRKK